jgi:glycosyltransferase involved in cell wall biosynthesis
LHDLVKEIILVDDGSPLRITISESSKVRYYRISHHGIGYARNFGVSKATQPFIFILDSDITVSKHLIDSFFQVLKERRADIACLSYVEAYVKSIWAKCEELYWRHNESQTGKWWLSCGCMMVKRDIFNKIKFEESVLSDEDTLFSEEARRLRLKSLTLPLTAKHVFAVTLKSLKRKWYYGGKRVALNQTKNLNQVVKGLVYSPIFAVKLAMKYRYAPLIPFIIIRTITFFRGFVSISEKHEVSTGGFERIGQQRLESNILQLVPQFSYKGISSTAGKALKW